LWLQGHTARASLLCSVGKIFHCVHYLSAAPRMCRVCSVDGRSSSSVFPSRKSCDKLDHQQSTDLRPCCHSTLILPYPPILKYGGGQLWQHRMFRKIFLRGGRIDSPAECQMQISLMTSVLSSTYTGPVQTHLYSNRSLL